MLFFLSHFLFLLQGICGSGRHGEDFRFCAERMQTEKGHLRYKSQENAISIANSASELAVSAPFSPERQQNTNISESRTWPLPELPGSYRFCVYWFQHARIFMLSYGSTKNYTLSKGAAYFLNSPNISGEATEGGTRLLFNVSYAFDKGWQNKSLPSSSAYFFRFTDSGKRRQESKSDQRSDVESEFRIAEAKLKDLEMARRLPRHGQSHNESPFVALQHLESALGAMEFQGQNKSFGEGALLRASIWKVPSRGPHELLVRSQLQVSAVESARS
ncbi:adhesion G-protein coupled receptor G1-like [Varanus komodoensis]|uniref:adhesion G-protein coupled receptor G1-like n=1 Tax=Varanus komodoensis TaxID=61221 RepID=UPI001CF7B36E|nr:adhesion G-protein coupled receptor G1-like [Varanus komodoensis]XP_044290166.1 adhesion G-protein coupled receptor G1-like [Varanus komodoensis]